MKNIWGDVFLKITQSFRKYFFPKMSQGFSSFSSIIQISDSRYLIGIILKQKWLRYTRIEVFLLLTELIKWYSF